MLTHLSISNFALIDNLEVAFSGGLNILTGETGSGKSIIIEALELLLGERADMKSLRDPQQKCIIEGEFSIKAYGLEEFFRQHEMDYSDQTLFRREINPQGKSRSFINDTPVPLTLMRELGGMLVDVHSQHQTLNIARSVNQFEFLDAYCGNLSSVESYRKHFREWHKLGLAIEELREQESKARVDGDYYRFQLEELEKAQLKPGELEQAEEELSTAEHAEDIRTGVEKGLQLLGEEQQGILVRLKELRISLSKISSYNRSLEAADARLESVFTELRDIESELETIAEGVLIDPERTRFLRDRVDVLNHLLFKHRLQSVDDLLLLRSELLQKVEQLGNFDERIAQLENQRLLLEKQLLAEATKLSARRKKSIPELEMEVNTLLQSLSMPHAALQIECKEAPLNNHGTDQIRFLIRTNKGGEFGELAKMASGGEFSRIMLALKSIFARVKTLPTIIFDEIDTGVSGEVAHRMGAIMKKMGESMQVFSITHLPQVAVKGQVHYKVYKEVGKTNTQTRMIRLSEQQRLEEVARMLSGDKLSDAALANARELMLS